MLFRSFSKVAGLSTDGAPPFLFYMVGAVAWSYFASCLSGTARTFVANADLLGKIYFHRLVIPVSVVLSNLISLNPQSSPLTGRLPRSCPYLLPINILSVSHSVEHHRLPYDVIADSIRPDLQTPLANALAFEFLDLWRRTERIRFETLDRFKDLLLDRRGEILEVALEARR